MGKSKGFIREPGGGIGKESGFWQYNSHEAAEPTIRVERRTCIIIVHRLSTIQSRDRVVGLHKGKIQKMGTREELR